MRIFVSVVMVGIGGFVMGEIVRLDYGECSCIQVW